MKVFLKIFFVMFSFVLIKCSQPIILKNKIDEQKGILQFGITSDRNFFVDKNISYTLEQIWSNETYGSFSNSSLLVYDKYLFVSDLSGRLFVFDRLNGKQIGYEKFSGEILVSPIINSFRIYIPVNNSEKKYSTIITFDFLQGKILNELKIDGKINFELIKADDGILVITNKGEICKVNFIGDLEWKVKLDFEIISNASLKNNLCFLGNNKSELILFDLAKKEIIKKIKLQSNITSGIAFENDFLFFTTEDGTVYSYNYVNNKINWYVKTNSKAITFPVQDSKNIYIGNLGGEYFCFEKISGKIIWKFSSNSLFNSTPLLFNNLIVIPDNNKKVYLRDVKNGNVLSTLNFERRVKLTPLFYEGIIYFGVDRGEIYAYKVSIN